MEIAARLRQAGEMLRLSGESRYRAAAYESGADALEALTEDLSVLIDQDRLTELRGIGPSLATTITELARTGRSTVLAGIMGHFPPGLLELAHLPGLTIRRIRTLHDALGIGGLDDLRAALAAGAVATVKGFGPHTVARLRAALEDPPAAIAERWVLVDALEWAQRLVAFLRSAPGVVAADVVGSVRRSVETVADVNLLAAAAPGAAVGVVQALTDYPAVAAVVERQQRSCRLRLSNGLPVTLAIEAPARFAVGLMLSTGSAAHLRRLQSRAEQRGLNLDTVTADSETVAYAAVGLPFIPPELREDAGEIEAADGGDDFRDLIAMADIRGMVHCHSVYSDGRHTIAQMAEAAAAMGMEYITITDHSPAASYAGGLTPERLQEQWREIADVQARVDIKLLRGSEVDILRDGTLDYPETILASLDVAIASIHERHRLDPPAMTDRLVRAMANPLFKIWGHGLGRLLLRREPIACDVDRVLDVVAGSPAAIEVNGSPRRLDLPAEWIRSARRRGIKFVISTDAHSTSELANLRFGVALARRGGLRRSDVLNTLPADQFAAIVRPRPGDAAGRVAARR
jgi:DNA polymerase (family 10)